MTDAVLLLARLLMSVVFIRSGIGKLLAPAGTMATFHHDRLPLVGAVYALAVAVEIGGGVAVLLGWRTRAAAIILAAWCIATAAVGHWHPGISAQMVQFTKNLCMAGGFLLLWAQGAGRFSIDRR
ncbi:MAG TPA: DoxX family protein [Acetobacteraceae bacterium]|nr:DoxX family protein [Acetobacteraceae bacterium]